MQREQVFEMFIDDDHDVGRVPPEKAVSPLAGCACPSCYPPGGRQLPVAPLRSALIRASSIVLVAIASSIARAAGRSGQSRAPGT